MIKGTSDTQTCSTAPQSLRSPVTLACLRRLNTTLSMEGRSLTVKAPIAPRQGRNHPIFTIMVADQATSAITPEGNQVLSRVPPPSRAQSVNLLTSLVVTLATNMGTHPLMQVDTKDKPRTPSSEGMAMGLE